MTRVLPERRLRILDLDIENRPLTYWQPDRPTADITAIAWMFTDDHESLTVRALGEVSQEQMLLDFCDAYAQADIVTGHYLTRHDLPIINGALYEHGLPLLSSKRASDTKTHMFTKADVPATQEYLLELLDPQCPLGIELVKYHMTQDKWRRANRLTPEGIALTKKRVTTDVHAHVHLREAMLDRGWLGFPTIWSSGGGEVIEGRISTGESK